jgi:hypothetical protein
VDQSKDKDWFISPSNVEGTNDSTNSSSNFGTPPWLHHVGSTMAAKAWPRPSPRQLEDLRRSSASSRCFSFVSVALWWMDRSIIPPWVPKGLYLCPWGALGRAPPCLARDLPWEKRELGFHKICLVQIFLIRSPSLSAPYMPRTDSK